MTLSSMTGFARSDGSYSSHLWHWEVRSVNGKGLDVRCRLPNGYEGFEPEIRKRVNQHFKRGNFQVSLLMSRQSGDTEISINEAALQTVLDALDRLKGKVDTAQPRPESILALRGVLDIVDKEESEDQRSKRDQALAESLGQALIELDKARRSEGAKLGTILVDSVKSIQLLAEKASMCEALLPDKLRARLKTQVEELLGAMPGLSEERLAQEAAILMTKADIREEIDRLKAHTETAYELLEKDEPVGRRLDFLMQEFNREANTLCAKASDVELTRIGLDLKAVIDQVREQVQNIE